jgi:hypothetical protein
MIMPLTYDESAALMTDFAFRGRVKVAALKYADSILGEPTNTPAHNTREKWANQTFQNPEAEAMKLQPPVVMDAAVQTDGAAILDPALQGSVEAVVNKML